METLRAALREELLEPCIYTPPRPEQLLGSPRAAVAHRVANTSRCCGGAEGAGGEGRCPHQGRACRQDQC